MLDIFVRIFDVISPPHPSVLKLRHESPEKFRRFYSLQKVFHCVCLSDYSQAQVRSAITANKFHNHQKASVLLASLVNEWLEKQPTNETLIFVPIPLAKKRQRERGYNQVTRILSNIKDEKVTIQNLLTRTKETARQTELDRSLRQQNVTGAFAYKKPTIDLKDQHIILIDDVVTTGSTMKEAGKVLGQNLPQTCKVTYLALAH